MQAPTRLWWNADKTRLVKDGDEEAAILAYPAGAELAAIHEDLLDDGELERKEAAPAANKARKPGQNKSGD